jgi:hypothetical protein
MLKVQKTFAIAGCVGKKTALLQPDFSSGLQMCCFVRGAACLEYRPKHQLPLRAKAGGENKFFQGRSVCH